MSGEEDPGREIFGYTQHLPVPVWVDKNAYSACHHCESKFSSMKEATKQHHCRLCGHMFCGSCTAKYHVPIVYEQKGKKGPTRVCIACRDSCLSMRDKEKTVAMAASPQRHAVLSNQDLSKAPSGPSSPKSPQFMNGHTQIEITPPEWEDEAKFIECAKCHKKGGKPHNCRTCGKLFCDTCTSKMVIPPCFEKKKKVGPARVCGECRFKILAGAKLVERLSTDLPELGGGASGAPGAKGAGNSTVCIVKDCGAARVSKNGYCAAHVIEFGSGDADLAASASLTLRWEGEGTILTRVALLGKDMTLTTIDQVFRKQLPAFAAPRQDFEYLYKSEGIDPVFFDVFTAAAFTPHGNSIYIRKKVDTDLLVAAYARQGVGGRATAAPSQMSAHGDSGANHSGVPQNPFRKRHDAAEAEKRRKLAAAAPVVKKEVVVFRKPNVSPSLKVAALGKTGAASVTPTGPGGPPKKGGPPPIPGQKGPPPPPGGAGAAGRPAAGPGQYKERAVKYFGAV